FLQLSCKAAGIDDWKSVYKHNEDFDRPAEVDQLIADPKKAHQELGWKPSITFEQLVTLMVEAEIETETKLANE
ncbi:GDP-mannose 4,6-dehydratase, partial [Patescibacteria group bacterium]|nr:GDP-mannose 4,6-dehydratase [Patescibacteria group bacterium]MBU1885424.1 GDP-mannose 4,6-dehydratase [Patescibacteria group bacterium]